MVDPTKCIGCKYCILACPYDSRRFLRVLGDYYAFNHPTPYEVRRQNGFEKGTVVNCDFCGGRLAKGRLPACVETCPAQARHFGDLEDPRSGLSRLIADHRGRSLREELGTKPSVYYIRD